jgi:hypothetical protein
MSERKSVCRIVVKNNRELFSERELEEIESARAAIDMERKSVNIDEMMASLDE